MSEENVDLVRRALNGGVQLFWEMLDEHVVWDLRDRPLVDFDDIYVGREAVIRASRHYWGTWEEYSLEAEELIDAGTGVVVVVRERGRGKGSGASFDDRWAQVWTFSRGRIVRWELFNDRATALEAAGVQQ